MVNMIEPPPEPSVALSDPAELLAGYLDFHRDAVLRKLGGLSDDEARRSRVLAGWVPVGLLEQLVHVERRWLQWGLAAEQVDRPWADHEPGSDDRWLLEPDDTLDSVREFFLAQCERSRAIVAGARLEDRSAV